jgi:RHS repeat-associated protein
VILPWKISSATPAINLKTQVRRKNHTHELALGNEYTITDLDEHRATTVYDSDNEQAATGKTRGKRTMMYDAVYRTRAFTRANRNATYSVMYDCENPATSVSGLFRRTLNLKYDANRNLSGLQDSLGGTMTVAYNADNMWTTKEWAGGGMSAMRIDRTYDANNQKATDKRYSDLTATTKVGETDYTFSAGGDLTNETYKNGSGTVLQQVTYTYGTGTHRVASRDLNGTTVSYSYDAANELTNDGVATYTYDSNGNRTMTGYTTGTGNQLTNDGTFTYTYDNDGNMTEKSKGTGLETWFYTYDNKGHLLTVNETTNGTTSEMQATYTYDAFGNMAKEVEWQTGVGTTTTEHVYDQATGNLLLDLNGSNALVMRYMSDGSQNGYLGRQDGSGNTSWYMTDRLGSVIGLTNGSGTATDTIVYDGFGNKTTESAPTVTGNIQFQGMFTDSATGQSFTNKRPTYNPMVGRWMTPDPSGFNGGVNLYGAMGNDATNMTDPNGLEYAAFAEKVNSGTTLGLQISQTGYELAQKSLAKAEALGKAGTLFNLASLHNGKGDAFRHCYWSALMKTNAKLQPDWFVFDGDFAVVARSDDFVWIDPAFMIGFWHETYGNAGGQPPIEFAMDMNNNNVGLEIGAKLGVGASDADILKACEAALSDGKLIYINNGKLTGPATFDVDAGVYTYQQTLHSFNWGWYVRHFWTQGTGTITTDLTGKFTKYNDRELTDLESEDAMKLINYRTGITPAVRVVP